MKALIDQLKAARAVSTPLIAITTPDQPAAAQEITNKLNGDTPVVQWDRARGLAPRNKAGIQALKDLVEAAKAAGVVDESFTVKDLLFASAEPASAMRFAQYLPQFSILIAISIDRFFRTENEGSTIQAILNLRDLFKSNKRTFIMLAPSFNFPPELQHDVILMDDPLPTNEGYGKILSQLYKDSQLKDPKPGFAENVTRTVRGLSAFEAEQVLAMSLAMNGGKGVDMESAWDLKKTAVSKIDGLELTLDGPDVSDLRGLDSILADLNDLWLGPEPPELVVRIDEIDKSLAGLGSKGGPGDNTGVTQDLNKMFLTEMESNGWLGYILVGLRGTGKTVLTESVGKAHGVPTISMDTGKMMKGIVGESQQAFREAFRTIKSIGGKRVIVFATANRLDVLPPELLRRFKLGIVFFDLPSDEERDGLWNVYIKKYGLDPKSERPNDKGWTGSDIRNCCEIAYLTRRDIKKVGQYSIVPVASSDPDSVKAARAQADNRFLSASYPGPYRIPTLEDSLPEPSHRKLNFQGGNQ